MKLRILGIVGASLASACVVGTAGIIKTNVEGISTARLTPSPSPRCRVAPIGLRVAATRPPSRATRTAAFRHAQRKPAVLPLQRTPGHRAVDQCHRRGVAIGHEAFGRA